MKDWQKFGLLALLVILLAWLFRGRKPVLTQTSSQVRGATVSPEAGSMVGPVQDELGQLFTRVCAYEAGARLTWPFLTQPCPPQYAGSPLMSDSLEPKV